MQIEILFASNTTNSVHFRLKLYFSSLWRLLFFHILCGNALFAALQLHPDKNRHPKAEIAFKLVSEVGPVSFPFSVTLKQCGAVHSVPIPNKVKIGFM